LSLVHLPVWMWVARPDSMTWGPARHSKTDRGLTVTLTARVDRVVWDMGDGASVTCASAGTARPGGGGREASPDCGHIYDKPSATETAGDGAYPIAATSYWSIDWTGGGRTGTLALDLTARTNLRVLTSSPVLRS